MNTDFLRWTNWFMCNPLFTSGLHVNTEGVSRNRNLKTRHCDYTDSYLSCLACYLLTTICWCSDWPYVSFITGFYLLTEESYSMERGEREAKGHRLELNPGCCGPWGALWPGRPCVMALKQNENGSSQEVFV